MGFKSREPRPEILELRTELMDVLKKHGDKLDALEILALCAHMTGQVIAMQDQRKYTGPMLMEMVAQNIEVGNREAIASLEDTKGNA